MHGISFLPNCTHAHAHYNKATQKINSSFVKRSTHFRVCIPKEYKEVAWSKGYSSTHSCLYISCIIFWTTRNYSFVRISGEIRWRICSAMKGRSRPRFLVSTLRFLVSHPVEREKKRVMLAGWSQVVRVTLHCLPSGNRSLSMLDEGQRGLEGDRIAWKWR